MSEKLLTTFFKVETTHWWWIGRKKIVISLLKMHLKRGNNIILDAGCGTGAGLLYLKKFGKVYGLDLSPVATKFCKKRGIKNIKTGDVSNLPYRNKTFDLVCLMDVIEHTSRNDIVLQEIFRVLKPNGKFLMTLPALPFIFSKHDKEQGHFQRYTKTQIQQLLLNAGFIEKKISYFNIFLSFPIILIRLLSKTVKPLEKLADFDSRLNYAISKKTYANRMLTTIFSLESFLLKYINLPFGISILTIYEKPSK